MTLLRSHPLNDGYTIPPVGFGTWPLDDDQAERAVTQAIRLGYRLIDTAARYENETGVGRALRGAEVAREQLFVTTKLRGRDHGFDATLRAFDASLGKLGLDYVDHYLIHWPLPARGLYVESWKAMVRLRKDGRVRSLGVSNFEPEHLTRLIDETGVVPAINQIELHPAFAQPALRAFHAQHGIVTEAWGPLGRGRGYLDSPALVQIAERVGRSAAQVVLRWHLELGNVVIPKSSDPGRMAQNLALFDFALDDEALTALGALDRGARLGPDPASHEEL
ncbi:MAG: aldo/keto reductase [Labilithrix sp.]|nr:aldo/keto reductase [Labilithrix sp.]